MDLSATQQSRVGPCWGVTVASPWTLKKRRNFRDQHRGTARRADKQPGSQSTRGLSPQTRHGATGSARLREGSRRSLRLSLGVLLPGPDLARPSPPPPRGARQASLTKFQSTPSTAQETGVSCRPRPLWTVASQVVLTFSSYKQCSRFWDNKHVFFL